MTRHIGVPVLCLPGRRVGTTWYIGAGEALDSVLNVQKTNFEKSHNFLWAQKDNASAPFQLPRDGEKKNCLLCLLLLSELGHFQAQGSEPRGVGKGRGSSHQALQRAGQVWLQFFVAFNHCPQMNFRSVLHS